MIPDSIEQDFREGIEELYQMALADLAEHGLVVGAVVEVLWDNEPPARSTESRASAIRELCR